MARVLPRTSRRSGTRRATAHVIFVKRAPPMHRVIVGGFWCSCDQLTRVRDMLWMACCCTAAGGPSWRGGVEWGVKQAALIGSMALAALGATAERAVADGLPVKAPPAPVTAGWSGLYLGAHVGLGGG